MTLLVLSLAYFLPSIIAHNKRNAGAIFVLNLLTGWTVIGWIIAFGWAMSDEPVFRPVYVTPYQACGGSRLCANCGKYSLRDAIFCSTCGSRFR
jgi:hypothetical protein